MSTINPEAQETRKHKFITAENARMVLMDMEVGVTGLENDMAYFLLLDQAQSFVSSLIRNRLTNSIIGCKRIELADVG